MGGTFYPLFYPVSKGGEFSGMWRYLLRSLELWVASK